jgi:hypothetical protein
MQHLFSSFIYFITICFDLIRPSWGARLLKLLHCRLSMSRVKLLLVLILNNTKSCKNHKIADSAAVHMIVRCGCFACCGGVWISTHCWAGLFSVCVCVYTHGVKEMASISDWMTILISGIACGFFWNTLSFKYPHRKRSQGLSPVR